ncbi:MAG: hypothetical protein ACFB21_10980 [Opitutales bacterium]
MPLATRRRILTFFCHLAHNPFDEGDFEETDASHRPVYGKIFGKFSIGYHPDHPVREVKVFEITLADDKAR